MFENFSNSTGKLTIYSKDKQGQTILHVAARFGQFEIMKYVLSLGSVVNSQTNNGFSPLHIACLKNQISCVKILLLHPGYFSSSSSSSSW